MEKLEALLNSPDSELVMSDFDSANSTPEKRREGGGASSSSKSEVSKPPAKEVKAE